MDAYYQRYNPTGIFGKILAAVFKGNLNTLLNTQAEVFEEPLRAAFEKEKVSVLLLGSATPKNLKYLQHFLTKNIGASNESDIFLIDNNKTALKMHRKYIETDAGLPKVHIFGGDITAQPIRPRSVDILVSDYTANFLQTKGEWESLFQEIERTLTERGRAIVQVRTTNDPDIDDFAHGLSGGEVDVVYPNERLLRSCIDTAGLEVQTEKARSSVTSRAFKEELKILLLRRKTEIGDEGTV